jgi:predicted O-methyltransferase YrrM
LKYKKYFRKTSLKQPGVGEVFLEDVNQKNPKTFLEIGVFHGVTARNVCELMYNNHRDDFKYIGIDIFEESEKYKNEVVPVYKFNNPIKSFYFKYIKKQNPYSIEAVQDLLIKFKTNVEILKGNSNQLLLNLKNNYFDYIFIDGGHAYETVKNDINICKEKLSENGTILCDDYDLGHTGVKKAVDEFVSENKCKMEIIKQRFAKIEF